MTRGPRMRIVVALLATASLVFAPLRACGAQPRRINVTLRGYENPVMLDTMATFSDLAESPGRVFHAMVKVLDDLQMPRTDVDSARGLLANKSLLARTRFAGHPMSWAIHCGAGMLGDYADSWRVSMAWAIYVDSLAPGKTRIAIAVVAGANNVEGAYKPPVACGTTGSLEAEIAKRVKLFLVSE